MVDSIAHELIYAVANALVATFFLTVAGISARAWWKMKGKKEFLGLAVFSVIAVGRAMLVVAAVLGHITPPLYLIAWDAVIAVVAYTALIISVRDDATATEIIKSKE